MRTKPTPEQVADAAAQAAAVFASRGQTDEATVSWLMADRYKQSADKEKKR